MDCGSELCFIKVKKIEEDKDNNEFEVDSDELNESFDSSNEDNNQNYQEELKYYLDEANFPNFNYRQRGLDFGLYEQLDHSPTSQPYYHASSISMNDEYVPNHRTDAYNLNNMHSSLYMHENRIQQDRLHKSANNQSEDFHITGAFGNMNLYTGDDDRRSRETASSHYNKSSSFGGDQTQFKFLDYKSDAFSEQSDYHQDYQINDTPYLPHLKDIPAEMRITSYFGKEDVPEVAESKETQATSKNEEFKETPAKSLILESNSLKDNLVPQRNTVQTSLSDPNITVNPFRNPIVSQGNIPHTLGSAMCHSPSFALAGHINHTEPLPWIQAPTYPESMIKPSNEVPLELPYFTPFPVTPLPPLEKSKKKGQKQRKDRNVKEGRKFKNEIDTNVISLNLRVLKDDVDLIMGDPIFCDNCTAALNFHSQLTQQTQGSDEHTWECEFCEHKNAISLEPEEIPTKDSVNYFIENEEAKGKATKNDVSLIFCIDISGSMCVTKAVEGNFELKGDRLHELQSLLGQGDLMNQFMFEERDQTYISRLQCVQAAVESQLLNLKTSNPDKKVGLVTFNNNVTIYGDGTQISQVISGDKLNNYKYLLENALQT